MRKGTHAGLLLAAICTTLCTSAAFAQCGDPGAGDCCSPTGSPGCDDAACCEAVCALDAFCCDTEWDEACAAAAAGDPNCACGGGGACGDPGAGDCCAPNGTPGCDDAACCSAICAADPFCCDTDWDQLCVNAAVKSPDCNCSAAGCGDKGAGECCFANGTPACDDADCCNSVCAADPFCCDTAWDQLCADGAALDPNCNCTGAGECGGAIAGACCEANGTPACDDADCCNSVCAADPFCCDSSWDQLCADGAALDPNCNCDGDPDCPGDLDGTGDVGPSDLAIILGNWGPCPGCAADINSDGTVGPADLAIPLGTWGPCK